MPLTEKVTFKTLLQKGNRLQVPELIRWQFKMESNQILNENSNLAGHILEVTLEPFQVVQ